MTEVAGPYDRSFTKTFRQEMKEQDWFQEETKVSMTHFIPGANVGKLLKTIRHIFEIRQQNQLYTRYFQRQKFT